MPRDDTNIRGRLLLFSRKHVLNLAFSLLFLVVLAGLTVLSSSYPFVSKLAPYWMDQAPSAWPEPISWQDKFDNVMHDWIVTPEAILEFHNAQLHFHELADLIELNGPANREAFWGHTDKYLAHARTVHRQLYAFRDQGNETANQIADWNNLMLDPQAGPSGDTLGSRERATIKLAIYELASNAGANTPTLDFLASQIHQVYKTGLRVDNRFKAKLYHPLCGFLTWLGGNCELLKSFLTQDAHLQIGETYQKAAHAHVAFTLNLKKTSSDLKELHKDIKNLKPRVKSSPPLV